jgi:UDP-GlcNAc:undecaprenyl-phosphate/decaprenyl-phosphate GlcNAc-1-phosphate transferase
MIAMLGILFVCATVFSLLLTPVAIRIAHFVGAIDLPNDRKIHSHPMPRLGGLAIYGSVVLSLLLCCALDRGLFSDSWLLSWKGAMLFVSLMLVLLLGVWDDVHSLGPGKKFLIQFFSASLVYFAGFHISSITYPLGNAGLLSLGTLDFPATVLWIVGVSNAFNLIDGLDGLASGVALIASLTVASIAYLNGNIVTAVPMLLLGGALFGFLRYNFNPAKIFLGDSGSLFVGFILATFSMESSTKGSTAFAMLVPILCLGLPIMDTLLAMARRFLGSLLSEKTIHSPLLHKLHIMFLPDKKHIHHQLIARGFSQRRAVLLLYFISSLFGLGAFGVTVLNNVQASFILMTVGVITVAGVRQLRYKEISILRNGILLPIYDWPVVNRAFFHAIVDTACCGCAFILSYHILPQDSFPNSDLSENFRSIIILVCMTQVLIFASFSLYKKIFSFIGINDVLKITQMIAVASLGTAIIFSFLPLPWNVSGIPFWLTDFYLLLTFIAGTRGSFYVLRSLFRRPGLDEKGVLIYGADTKGVLIMQQFLEENYGPNGGRAPSLQGPSDRPIEREHLAPLGFLDDTPRLEGKQINGYPIFGGQAKLPQLVRKHRIGQILVSDENIRPEALRRLKKFAEEYGITVRRPKILLEDIWSIPEHRREYSLQSAIENNPNQNYSMSAPST